jgi:hypothetical protein
MRYSNGALERLVVLWQFSRDLGRIRDEVVMDTSRRGIVVIKALDTNRKVAGSRPEEVNEFFSMYLILPAALGPGVYSVCNWNEYQKQKNNICGE